jgi:2,4-dienoyl-CoA reductase-like NADH-dependent reductase (Old Yellow Enzyme family)
MSQRYESENADVDVSPLGKPLKFEFSGKTAQNRFMKGAMTERISSWDPKVLEKRGVPTKNLVNVYQRWGEGQYGVILTGNVMIEYDHLEAKGNPIVPRDAPFSGERFDAFKDMATQAKKHGSLVVAQVSHPGRQVTEDIQPNPISASDVKLDGGLPGMSFAKPRAATEQDIKNVIEGFAHAAEYLEKAGYDGIQLHGAHGYLLAQFLSQTTNLRTDKYGGSLENRARIVVEIAQEIRKRVAKDFSLSIKINSVEFQDKGFTPEEAKGLCQILEDNQFDFVELSGGTYQSLAFTHKRESTKKRESFFLEFAEQIVPGLKHTKTYVTGGLRTVSAMVGALDTVDGVGLARPTTQEFDIPNLILQGKAKGGVKPTFGEDNFGLCSVACGTQMRQVGKGEQPIDLLMKSMEAWQKQQADDHDGYMVGFIDLDSSFKPNPYGQAYTKA